MPRYPHIEQRPWWPDALRRFEQLAKEGKSRYRAAQLVAEVFDAGAGSLYVVMDRGSVPSYPAKEPARAAAWIAEESRYLGNPCPVHKSRLRYSNDGVCVECALEHRARHDAKKS